MRPHDAVSRARALVLAIPRGPLVVEAKRYRRPPSPSELRAVIARHRDATKPLLIVDQVAGNLRDALLQHRVSYVTDDERALFLDDVTHGHVIDRATADADVGVAQTGPRHS